MRKRESRGFTLIEIMVVVVIIGILAGIFITQYAGQSDKAKIKLTRAAIKNVSNALDMFKLDFGRYPEKLDDLRTRPSYVDPAKWVKGGYLKATPVDGWDNEFVYRITENDPDFHYEVISLGGDEKEGGTGEGADLSNRDDPRKLK